MRGTTFFRKTLPGDPSVALVWRRSARAQRITLRVSTLDGRVTVTLPRHASEADAMRFVAEKTGWVREQLGRVADPRRVEIGTVLPLDGAARRVAAAAGGDATAIVVTPSRPVGPQVRRAVIEAARARFADAVARHGAALDRRPGAIRLRDTRSRWGSCSSSGDLMFSWRLILAPAAVADYVAAHEAAHLVHMDHSRAFWSAVARICPDWERCRAWLRTEGHTLHAWRFDT